MEEKKYDSDITGWITRGGKHIPIRSDTSYQGGKYRKAQGTGDSVDMMKDKIASLPDKTKENNAEVIEVINRAAGNPDAEITVYRATVGDDINGGDWVFLDRAHAEKWTKTPMGTPKPGVKVLEKTTKAKHVEWTGKNLEFVYIGESAE